MTVKELQAKLAELPENAELVMYNTDGIYCLLRKCCIVLTLEEDFDADSAIGYCATGPEAESIQRFNGQDIVTADLYPDDQFTF